MSSSGSEDEARPPSAQPRADAILPMREDLHFDTMTASLSSSDEEDHGEDDISDGDLSDPPDPDRPNRLTTDAFQRQFAEQREISRSMDSMRSRDLAVHLYNTFQLRERAKKLRAQSSEDVWEPTRNWTAWPVPAKLVPREREEEQLTGDHAWTLCGKPDANSTGALEDTLIALSARRARERYAQRPSESDSEVSGTTNTSPVKDLKQDVTDDRSILGSQSTAWTADIVTQPQKPPISAPDDRHKRPKRENSSDRRTELSSDESSEDDDDDDDDAATDKISAAKRSSVSDDQTTPGGETPPGEDPPQTFLVEEADLYPHPLTDDDHIRKLLGRPTRHTLVKLDHLLAAMHHSRAFHVSKSRRKPLPVSSSRANTRSITEAKKLAGSYPIRSKLMKYETWDWSNVLGFAAIAGWDDKVVQRARARCERLFGQKMEFVTSIGGSNAESTEATGAPSMAPSTQPANIQDLEMGSTWQEATVPVEGSKRYPQTDDGTDQVAEAHDIKDDLSQPTEPHGIHSTKKDRPALEVKDGLHVDGFLQPLHISVAWKLKGQVDLPIWQRRKAPMEAWESSSSDSDASIDIEEEEDPSTAPNNDDPNNAELDTAMPDAEPIAEPSTGPKAAIDPELLAIDPQLLAPSLNLPVPTTSSSTIAASEPGASSPSHAPMAPNEAASEANPIAGPSSAPATAVDPSAATAAESQQPQPPPKPKPRRPNWRKIPPELRRPRGRPPKPKPPPVPKPPKEPKVPKKRVQPVYEGPKAPWRLRKTTKYERTPEEIEMWRARGYIAS